MTLIARQQQLVALLQPIHRQRIEGSSGGRFGGLRSRHKHKHVEEMVAAGYTRREAAESAQQCDDIAHLNADHDALVRQMGGAA